jgi:NTE family protein
MLADGALFDPLGLEAVWETHRVLLVSDATTMLASWSRSSSNWFRQLNRAILIQCDANSLIQRRNLFAAFASSSPECSRRGAYWCNSSMIAEYGDPGALAVDSRQTGQLGRMRTRLNRFSPQEQALLINWGYAMCDSAMRSRGLGSDEPGRLPVPEFGL